MEAKITNIAELEARITYLKVKKAADEIYFEQKIASIKNKFTHPFSFIKDTISSFAFGTKTETNGRADWATNLGRIFFPLFLNKTLLKNKGAIVKTLVSLFSQKAINSSVFNRDVLAGWIDNVTSFVKAKTRKEKMYGSDDYGIPPESETA